MLETDPQERGKCPIPRITRTQTRLESDKTSMQNNLHIGHNGKTIHLKHLCKYLSGHQATQSKTSMYGLDLRLAT